MAMRANILNRIAYLRGKIVEIRTDDSSCLLWPFVAVWRLLTALLKFTGRVLGIIVGFVLLVAGIVVSLTVLGAIVGIPMIIIGLLIIVRALF
jgi:hypothetical protein